jgi:hypothetical protein
MKTNDEQVLNRTLYASLKRRFSDVEVVARGEAISWRLKTSPLARRSAGNKPRMERDVIHSGEEYRLKCPVCKDHRARMYVNHRWGVWDPETNGYNLHLIQCFNEQCFADGDVQKQFFERIYGAPGRRIRQARVAEGRQISPDVVREIQPPGKMIAIDQLYDQQPRHHAIQYLVNRGFDPTHIGRRYQATYCSESRWSLAKDRIIIPIFMDDKLVGWQARYIGDSVNGTPFNKAGVPKYWSSPGMVRRLVAYNYDLAVKHRTVLIVEGPTDVWSAGPYAFGLLGKTMSLQLIRKFVAKMKRLHGENWSAFIVLDSAWDEVQKRKGKPHHIEKLYNQLAPSAPGRIGKLYLPEEVDPGDLSASLLRSEVKREARKQNIDVYFGRPKK